MFLQDETPALKLFIYLSECSYVKNGKVEDTLKKNLQRFVSL